MKKLITAFFILLALSSGTYYYYFLDYPYKNITHSAQKITYNPMQPDQSPHPEVYGCWDRVRAKKECNE